MVDGLAARDSPLAMMMQGLDMMAISLVAGKIITCYRPETSI